MSAPADHPTPYDEIPYLAQGSPWMHPCAVGATAAFLGHIAAPPETARFLDLGCGRGLSVLSLASQFPRASFVGVDLAARHIEEAQALARDAGLDNVTFIQADLSTYQPEGKFDYIACAGTYSWVPEEVRAGIRRIMADSLEADGLGAVLYAAQPGWTPFSAMREVMRYHASRYPLAAEKIDKTRALFQVLHDYASLANQEWLQPVWAAFGGHFAPEKEANLFHEILGEIHEAFSITEFAAQCNGQGLEFFAESTGVVWPALHINDRLRQTLDKLATGRLDAEQYFDFLTLRNARFSLVRRADAAHAAPRPDAASLDGFGLVAQISHALDRKTLRRPGEAIFTARGTQQFTVSDPAVKCLLAAHSRYPARPVGLAQLVDEAEPLLRGEKKKTATKKQSATLADAGRQAYARFIASGLVTPVIPAPNAAAAADHLAPKPLIHPLNRALAARGLTVISPNLVASMLTPATRALVQQCDGRTSQDKLYRIWAEARGPEPATAEQFQTTLAKLLQSGLFVAAP